MKQNKSRYIKPSARLIPIDAEALLSGSFEPSEIETESMLTKEITFDYDAFGIGFEEEE